MCATWANDYAVFARDVGVKPKGMTLDRINNDGDYEPNNVRWATRKEQANNRCTNTILTYEGKSMTLAQWADHLGLPYVVINSRWKKGRRPPELFMPRQTRVRNGLIEFDGKAMTLPEWASATGIPYPTLAWRLKHGKPLVPTEF